MSPGAPRQVWYAAYGSNLHWPRFRRYLEGGLVPGCTWVHEPCADHRPPRAQVAATLPFPLFFAGASRTWGGGVAFIDPARSDATTLARLYLVSGEQFAAIAAGEARRRTAPRPPPAAVAPRTRPATSGSYRTVVACGDRDGIPVLSLTGPPAGAQLAPPVPAYLRMIAAGLADAHDLDPPAVAAYLAAVPGAAGHYGHDDLVAIAGAGTRVHARDRDVGV